MSWCKPVKALREGVSRGSLASSSTIWVENCEECDGDVRPAHEGSFHRERTDPRETANLHPGNRKGCDIGYAPAISSCEGANRVDACTVAALDAITAFADPNPNCSSQNQSVFSGLVARQVALLSRSLSLLRSGKVYFANPFSRRRQPK
jgi:hypothetical protein